MYTAASRQFFIGRIRFHRKIGFCRLSINRQLFIALHSNQRLINVLHCTLLWRLLIISSFPAISLTNSYFCDAFRIRTEQSGGAWCPKQQITRDVYEWLQVDLGRLKVISLVETQGRFGNGQVESAIRFHNNSVYLFSFSVDKLTWLFSLLAASAAAAGCHQSYRHVEFFVRL